MKKLLITGILILLPFLTFSQNKFGVFAGVNAATLSDGLLESVYIGSNSFSFHIGGVYELELKEKIAFRPKLIYSQQGDREDLDNHIRYELTYLNIPLNIKFFKSPYLLFGPQVGILINTKKQEFDLGDFPTLDYGLNIGGGVDIKDFFVELNAYQGLRTLVEVEFPNKSIDATNTVIQLSLGYHF